MSIAARQKILSVVGFIGLLAFGILLFLPFFIMIIAAITPVREIFAQGLGLRVNFELLTLDNFRALWTIRNGIYWRFFFNSVFVTTVSTVLVLVFTSMVGYGLAMYRFRGRNFLVMLVLCTMMVPQTILILPLFRLLTSLNIMDTYLGLILPTMLSPFSIFFFRQFCMGLSKDFAEAARIDGYNEAMIFVRIYVPMMTPAFGAMAILTGVGVWNDFLWPLVVLRTITKFTLPPGLMTSMTPLGDAFDILFAGSVMAVLPMIVLFLFNQRAFISGLTIGGIKG